MPIPQTLPADVIAAAQAAQTANAALVGKDTIVNDLQAQLAAATADEATATANARQLAQAADAAFDTYATAVKAQLEADRVAFDAALTEVPN